MNKKQELNQRLLFFNPEITFDGTIGGIKFVMIAEAFSNQINWVVYEGDHKKEFQNFDEACDYYIEMINKK